MTTGWKQTPASFRHRHLHHLRAAAAQVVDREHLVPSWLRLPEVRLAAVDLRHELVVNKPVQRLGIRVRDCLEWYSAVCLG